MVNPYVSYVLSNSKRMSIFHFTPTLVHFLWEGVKYIYPYVLVRPLLNGECSHFTAVDDNAYSLTLWERRVE